MPYIESSLFRLVLAVPVDFDFSIGHFREIRTALTIELRDQRTKRAQIGQPFDQTAPFIDWIDGIRANVQLAPARFAVLLQTLVEQVTEIETTRIDTKIILRLAQERIQLPVAAAYDDFLRPLQRAQHFDRILEA